MTILRSIALGLALLPAAVTYAQISQAGDYFGKLGNTDFRVIVSDDGASVEFQYYSAGLERATGPIGANSTATLITDRSRQVSVRVQGNTVSGTFLNQALSATRESNIGPLAGISGSYSGILFEAINGGNITGSSSTFVRVFPSGRALMFSADNITLRNFYGVGTMAVSGAVTFAISSSSAQANGDTWTTTFKPEADLASGNMTSRFFPRNEYGYAVTRAKAATVINVATRGTITPTQAMTAGFVVNGGVKTLLIRAVGPTLSVFGVTGANADPRLTLFSGQTVLTNNDNWGDNANAAEIVTASVQVGAFALNAGSRDAAILVQLRPGAYTAQALSVGSASGDALIEVYEVTK